MHPALADIDLKMSENLSFLGRGAEAIAALDRAIKLDGAMGALEIVALADLLDGLIDRVVHFLKIGAGRDVERGI